MWISAEILKSAHYDLDMIADGILKEEDRYRTVEEDAGCRGSGLRRFIAAKIKPGL